MDKKILLTICARGGSKGVPDKNIRELCGKPLIAHSIEQAKRWGKAARIICSTDSEKIADVARRYGAEILFLRPAELATDTAGKLAVLRHAWQETERVSGEIFDILIDLDVTAPVRKIDDIEGAYQTFLSRKPDAVVSVTPARRNPYFNMLEEAKDGYAVPVRRLERPIFRRQDAPKVYDMNASIYVYAKKFIWDEKTLRATQGRTCVWVMDEWSAFDIDSEVDLQLVEYLVNKKVVRL